MKQVIPIDEVYYRQSPPVPNRPYSLNENFDTHYNYQNLLECLQTWNSFNKDEVICFEQALNVLNCVLENGSPMQKATATSVVQGITGQLKSPKNVVKTLSNGVKNVSESNKEYYDKISESLNKNIEECRVISNHELISKRYGVDSFIRENTVFDKDYECVIAELCSYIDTYKFGLDSKYKVALEETLYAMRRANVPITEQQIVEAVTDYFAAVDMHPKDTNGKIFEIMEQVIDKNRFFSDSSYPAALRESLTRVNDGEIETDLEDLIRTNINEGVDFDSNVISKVKAMCKKYCSKYHVDYDDGTKIADMISKVTNQSRRSICVIRDTVAPSSISNVKNDIETAFKKLKLSDYSLECKRTPFLVPVPMDGLIVTLIKKESVHESYLTESASEKWRTAVEAFKAMPKKTEGALKSLIDTLFIVHRDEDIINNSYNFLSLVFYYTVWVGTLSIGIAPGIIGAIALKTINYNMERKYMDRVLKKWYAHRDSVHRKMEKCSDEEKKKKFEEYLKTIDKNIEKLEEHSDSLRGEDEKKSTDKRPTNYTGKKDDDFGDFDMNFDDMKFDESARDAILDLKVIAEAVSTIKWDDTTSERLLEQDMVASMNGDDLEYISEMAIKYPRLLNPRRVLEAVDYRMKLYSESKDDPLYLNRTILSENKNKLEKAIDAQATPEKEDTDKDVIKELNEIAIFSTVVDQRLSAMNELSITSNLKLAADKLMGVASSLSDKEQIISRNIDGACRFLQRSIEKSMSMENREAVIRGDILPSMSKIIKWVCIIGGAAFIHVGLAAVILLGKFAMDKKIRTKERQMVVDELDVELKMIDKYIADADAAKDYKKEKELLLIKKKLQHQNDRLKWNIKLHWGDKNVDVPLANKEGD